MTKILTLTTPYCSKTVKTNDFRFIIRSGEKVLQQRVVTYTCNMGGQPIKEESVEWKDIETVDNMELKQDE